MSLGHRAGRARRHAALGLRRPRRNHHQVRLRSAGDARCRSRRRRISERLCSQIRISERRRRRTTLAPRRGICITCTASLFNSSSPPPARSSPIPTARASHAAASVNPRASGAPNRPARRRATCTDREPRRYLASHLNSGPA